MRTLTLTGRVVSDATARQTKDGRNYLEFRFANNEWFDEKDKTFWIRISCYTPELINLKSYITKGKPLIIVGRYKDRIYTRQDGTSEIGRDLTAYSIEFPESNKREEADQTTVTETRPTATANPQVQPSSPVAVEQTQQAKQNTIFTTNTEDDDLPF